MRARNHAGGHVGAVSSMMQPSCGLPPVSPSYTLATCATTLLRIIIVQCHGGINNEQNFSRMNFIHNDLRKILKNKNLNAALRAWSEKDKLLADDRLFP
jgi:hypothetical protein